MTFQGFITLNAVADLGWTLLHSLWQITLVSAALLLTLRVLRESGANLFYCLSVAALILASMAQGRPLRVEPSVDFTVERIWEARNKKSTN